MENISGGVGEALITKSAMSCPSQGPLHSMVIGGFFFSIQNENGFIEYQHNLYSQNFDYFTYIMD